MFLNIWSNNWERIISQFISCSNTKSYSLSLTAHYPRIGPLNAEHGIDPINYRLFKVGRGCMRTLSWDDYSSYMNSVHPTWLYGTLYGEQGGLWGPDALTLYLKLSTMDQVLGIIFDIWRNNGLGIFQAKSTPYRPLLTPKANLNHTQNPSNSFNDLYIIIQKHGLGTSKWAKLLRDRPPITNLYQVLLKKVVFEIQVSVEKVHWITPICGLDMGDIKSPYACLFNPRDPNGDPFSRRETFCGLPVDYQKIA